jgi:mutator protein MutT
MRNIVNGLLVRGGSVLLAKRSSQRASYPGQWSFPGGHPEANETLPEALVREIREEIGITPTRYMELCVIKDPNAPSSDPIAYHMYLVTTWQGGEPAIIGDEHSKLAWMSFAAAASIRDLALEEYRTLFTQLGGKLARY